MLALKSSRNSPPKYTANILPCRIQLDGPAKVTKQYWSPITESDGTKTSYFRGRRLRGRVLKIPSHYKGILAKSTDRILPPESSSSPKRFYSGPLDNHEASDEDEDATEEQPEPVKVLETTGSFDEITVWGHDQLPPKDDVFVKGLEEWIGFAEGIHRPKPKKTKEDAGEKNGKERHT